MTETEKLARTIRLMLLGAVGLVIVAVVFVGLRAGIRWGWDAATTDRAERVEKCIDALEEWNDHDRLMIGGGAFAIYRVCDQSDGRIDEAKRLLWQGDSRTR